MKKFFVTLAAVAVVVCSAFSVSAATKDQLISKMEEIPTANNAVFHDGAVRVIKEANFTEAQMDKLIPILEEAHKVLPENKGAAARNYTKDQIDKIFKLLDEACAITGYSYKVTAFNSTDNNGNTVQGGDFGLLLYDNNKKLVLEYTDGIIKKTGEDATVNSISYVYLAAGILVLASAAAVVVVRKKNA